MERGRLIPEVWNQLALHADVGLVRRAVESLLAGLSAAGVSADCLYDVDLGVTEALTNAVVHGQAPPDASEVLLRWSWQAPWLTVEVSEPGEFRPGPAWSELPEDPMSESGRGGFLVTQAFDTVEHGNSAGRHTLRLKKNLGQPLPGPAAAEDLEATLGAMTEDLSASYETLSALFKLAETLATAGDLEQFTAKALELRLVIEADTMQLRVADAAGRLRLMGHAGDGPAPLPELAADAPGVEATVFRSCMERTIESAAALSPDDPLGPIAGSAFVAPILFQGRRLGVLALTRRQFGAHFTAAQIGLARTTSEFLGIACANAEFQAQRAAQLRLQRELEIAAQIQQSLVLTELPRRPEWSVHGQCQNALEVGGDFFDVLETERGLLLIIADVMGKGIPAAMLAATLRAVVRANSSLAGNPGRLLTRVAQQVAPDLERLEMFITAQAVFVPPGAAPVRWANAGHGPLLVLGENQASDCLYDEGGLPLGVARKEIYRSFRFPLRGGDRLMMVTDGILEAADPAGQELGFDGLRELAPRDRSLELSAMSAAIFERLRRRDAARPQHDDRTLLMFQRHS